MEALSLFYLFQHIRMLIPQVIRTYVTRGMGNYLTEHTCLLQRLLTKGNWPCRMKKSRPEEPAYPHNISGPVVKPFGKLLNNLGGKILPGAVHTFETRSTINADPCPEKRPRLKFYDDESLK
ncbi:Hypothetical protein NTJ_12415 [Nesidiocoris tenuis]|uniref:Uncharacterized protein n=1 Tax=Nesidiocoris tenuis TaxID=355587 RepID=A0ABN7B5B7_9HEMI|nr:Hypothetical protein NTJ_12415 [Nesidiocoris tenuis]